VLRSVFESWINRLRWVIKHEWKYSIESKEKKRHFFETGRESWRAGTDGSLYFVVCKFRRVRTEVRQDEMYSEENFERSGSRFEEGRNVQSVEYLPLNCISALRILCQSSKIRESWGRAVCSRRKHRTQSLVELHQKAQLHHRGRNILNSRHPAEPVVSDSTCKKSANWFSEKVPRQPPRGFGIWLSDESRVFPGADYPEVR
jgi:hypothetical protein